MIFVYMMSLNPFLKHNKYKVWTISKPINNYNNNLNKNFNIKRLCVRYNTVPLIFLLVIVTLFQIADATKDEVVTNCTFPQKWEGSWFLSGNQQPVFIKGSTLSFRGKCVASDGDKFLVVDDKGCHRCLVIYEKHQNVLQYKESECEGDNMFMDQANPAAISMQQSHSSIIKSDQKGGAHSNSRLLSSMDQFSTRSNDDNNRNHYCKGRETLQNLCEQIPGDALLYSLFKENGEPVRCPLRGPFTFTYNRGHGECKHPISNIESCTEESRLLLNLQACPDVAGTESTVEELTCLATWKDGNSRYLVGLVSHHHATSNEERFRCFVYEKLSSGGSAKNAEYKLAQSGDATCNGLDSAEVGSRIMTLRKAPAAERCDFPSWFKGPKHWRSLSGNNGYTFHQSDGSIHVTKRNGVIETRALCEQINKQTATELTAIVHYTTGCQSGFMCMVFYKRDTYVTEIQMGNPMPRLEDACTLENFNTSSLPYVTLLASNIDPQECPGNGIYGVNSAIGPPYISSRRKRNHSKCHHRHCDTEHKRSLSLGFRNSEKFSNYDWYTKNRNIPMRSRRDTTQNADETNNNKNVEIVSKNFEGDSLKQAQRKRRNTNECATKQKFNRQLSIGCSESNIIEVKPQCSEDNDEVYNCHGSWPENTTTYIIAKHTASQHDVCISYKSSDSDVINIFIGDSCYRGPGQSHHLAANLTVLGKCTDTSSSSTIHSKWLLVAFLIFSVISSYES